MTGRALCVLLLILAALPMVSCSPTVVAGTGWMMLGERTVDGRRDMDTVTVGSKKGVFHRIRFDVTGSALDLHSVVVTFGNSETFAPETRYSFGKGEGSRSIDFPGGGRRIEKVVFRYGNLPGGGRAHVTLYGER